MIKKIVAAFMLAVILTALCSCGEKDADVQQKSIFAMDTVIDIKLYETETTGSLDAESVLDECERIIREAERELSKTLDDSDVARINASEGESVEVGQQTLELIKTAFELTQNTHGAFDITLEPLCELWCVTNEDFVPPSENEISSALEHIGCDKLVTYESCVSKTDACAGIDLGGIGKGYAAQLVLSFLEARGYSALVSFGGNIGVVGEKPDGRAWNIAIRSPFESGETVVALALERGFVAVSGAYERYAEYDGRIYHHIIDPATGRPSESDLASVAIVCENGPIADALSTACFVLGSEKTLELYAEHIYDFEAILIKNDGELLLTDGISDRVKINE